MVQYAITREGDRVGPHMRYILGHALYEPPRSRYALSWSERGIKYGGHSAVYSACFRARCANIVCLDDSHPNAEPRGDGAVVPTVLGAQCVIDYPDLFASDTVASAKSYLNDN
jgi:hypothetical protein